MECRKAGYVLISHRGVLYLEHIPSRTKSPLRSTVGPVSGPPPVRTADEEWADFFATVGHGY